jgi:hypothetical protein
MPSCNAFVAVPKKDAVDDGITAETINRVNVELAIVVDATSKLWTEGSQSDVKACSVRMSHVVSAEWPV